MINILLMEERSWTKFYRVPGRMCGVISSNPQCHRSPDRTWNPVSIYYITPPKFHIAPEKSPSQKYSSLPTIMFKGLKVYNLERYPLPDFFHLPNHPILR